MFDLFFDPTLSHGVLPVDSNETNILTPTDPPTKPPPK